MAKSAAEALGPDAKLDPVFARALREALFWLLAALALVLFIALASFDPADRSFSYTGEPGRVSNLIGPLGAWLASALYLLFGWPAFLFPVAIAFSAWVGLKRATGEPAQGRTTVALRMTGLVAALVTSCALATLHFSAGVLPEGAGGIVGILVGDGLAAVASLLGATLVLLAIWFASVQLYTGVSWLTVMDWIGHHVLAAAAWVRARFATSRDHAVGRESREAREIAVREVKKKAEKRTPPRIEPPAPAVAEPSRRVEKERQVQLFAKPPSRDLPELKLLDEPPARPSSLFARGAGCDFAPRRDQAEGLRHRCRGGRGAAGTGGDALRAEAGARRQGQPDQRACEGPGACAVGDQRPRRRSHPGQGGGRPRDTERVARARHARRDPALARLRRAGLAARARARQGHRRQSGGRGSREDAAPADRGHDRLRQVRGHQRDGAVAALQELGGARAAHPHRPEDAGAFRLRRHPAPARAGRHRHEARRQRAALVRRGDGPALSPHEGAGRQEPRRLQSQGARRAGCRSGRSRTP